MIQIPDIIQRLTERRKLLVDYILNCPADEYNEAQKLWPKVAKLTDLISAEFEKQESEN